MSSSIADIPSPTVKDHSGPDVKPKHHMSGVTNAVKSIHHSIEKGGENLQSHLPSWVNNHAGSIISAAHLAGEIMMLKSNNLVFMENKRLPGGKVNILIDPAYNLFRAATGADKGGINNWGTRSTLAGMTGWTLGTILPDAPNDPAFDEKEKAKLANKSFLQKAGIHIGEAFKITDPHYKRQLVGLTTTVAGLCSLMSGLKSVDQFGTSYVSKSRAAGGLITALAGSQLLLTDNPAQAWTRYGITKWARLPFAYGSIKRMQGVAAKEFQATGRIDNNWKYYLGGQAGLQGGGILSILLGGQAMEKAFAPGMLLTATENQPSSPVILESAHKLTPPIVPMTAIHAIDYQGQKKPVELNARQ